MFAAVETLFFCVWHALLFSCTNIWMTEQTNGHPHLLVVLSPTTSIVDILYKRMHIRMIYVYVNGACQQKKGRGCEDRIWAQ